MSKQSYIELRPQDLTQFIGKEQIKANLSVYINAAKQRLSCLDHILFHGLAGTGKTSLALIIAKEMGTNIHIIQGNHLNKPIDIINLLSLIKENDVVFIDEIHACNPLAFETLYSVMEDFAIDVAIGKEFNAKTTRINLPKFTLIGATTAFGKIPKPLEERFGFSFFLSAYTLAEMCKLVSVNAKNINLEINESEVHFIAENAKGIPRIANRLLKRVLDFRLNNPDISVAAIFKQINIYENGLEECDVQYLKVLFEHETEIGLRSLAQLLELDVQTIEQKIEPHLIKNQYVTKTMRGRKITHKAVQFLNTLIKQ